MSGIRTTDDLKARCWVDEQTGCWHWRGATSDTGAPSMWVPELRKRTSLGVVVALLLTGHPPRPGVFWHCKCDTKGCANPWHRKPGTRSTQMLAAKMVRDPLQRARISLGKRGVSKLTDEQVVAIQGSTELLRVIAERYGISMSYASYLRNGARRNTQPLSGVSVFTWRAAA